MLVSARGELARAMLESSPWWRSKGRTGGLMDPATTQAQNQGYVLAHPNIHPICDLLEHRWRVGQSCGPRVTEHP